MTGLWKPGRAKDTPVESESAGATLMSGRTRLMLGTTLAIVAVILPMFGNGYQLYLGTTALIWLILAMALQLIFGYGGLLSVAHGGLFGLAAYTSALLNTEHGVPVIAAALIAIAFTTLVSAVIGAVSVRTTGMAFAVLTLAFGQIIYELILNLTSLTHGPLGVAGIEKLPKIEGLDADIGSYLSVAIVALIALAGLWWLVRSEFGRALVCTREDETLAGAYGINVMQSRRWAFAISGTFAAVAGVLFAHYFQFISPESFTFLAAFQALVMVVAGGAGLILGTIVGSVSLSLLPELLRDVARYEQVTYGVILFLAIRFLPRGIVGSVREWLLDRRLARRQAARHEVGEAK